MNWYAICLGVAFFGLLPVVTAVSERRAFARRRAVSPAFEHDPKDDSRD